MSVNTIIAVLVYLPIVAATFAGCEGSKSVENEISPAERQGGKLQASVEYFDSRPSVSDNGSVITFISGRDFLDDSENQSNSVILKAYKSNFAIGAEVVAPSRVTEASFNLSENEAVVSHDGTNIAIVATTVEENSDIFLYDLASNGVRITDDNTQQQKPVFSYDSAILAWTNAVIEQGGLNESSISVVNVSQPEKVFTFQDPSKVTRLLFFMESSIGYKLLYSTVDGTSGETKIMLLSFASVGVIENATPVEWAELGGIELSSMGSAISDAAFLIQRVGNSAAEIETLGNGPDDEPKVAVKTVVGKFSENGDLITTLAPMGHEVLSYSSSAKINFPAVALAVERHRCSGDSTAVYGRSMYLIDDSNTTQSWLLSVYDGDGAFVKVTEEFCLSEEDKIAGYKVDTEIEIAKINRDASSSNYRVVYVSKFQGDSEVMVLDYNNNSWTVRALSNHSTPSE